ERRRWEAAPSGDPSGWTRRQLRQRLRSWSVKMLHEGDWPVAPTAPCLFVKLIDKATFFELAHNAVVGYVFEAHGRVGLASERVFDLNFRSLPRHQRHSIIEFGDGRIGRFQICGVVLPAVLGNDLLTFLFVGFKKGGRLDQPHEDAFYGFSTSGQIRLSRRRADVGKLEALLEIRGADQNSMRHTLGQLNDSRWRRKAGDSAAAKRAGPLRRAADLQYQHVFDRFKPQSFDQNPRCHVRCATHAADSNAFAFELLCRFNRFLNDQLIRERVEKASDHYKARASHMGAGNSSSRCIPNGNIAGDDASDSCRRARYIDKLAIQAMFLEKATLLRRVPNRVARIHRAIIQLDSFLSFAVAVKPGRHPQYDGQIG